MKNSLENKAPVGNDYNVLETNSCFWWEGPNRMESWYNVRMDSNVRHLRDRGYDEESYPYHISKEGFKKLGEYIMCAANFEKYPFGTLIEGEYGTYIVADTGTTFDKFPDEIQIATDWGKK